VLCTFFLILVVDRKSSSPPKVRAPNDPDAVLMKNFWNGIQNAIILHEQLTLDQYLDDNDNDSDDDDSKQAPVNANVLNIGKLIVPLRHSLPSSTRVSFGVAGVPQNASVCLCFV